MNRIDKSLYKMRLIAGVESVYAIILSLLIIIVAVYGGLYTRIFGITFFVIIFAIMAHYNRKDAIYFKVLLRYFLQQYYYKAHSSVNDKKTLNASKLRAKLK